MAELGAEAATAHVELGRLVGQLGISRLVAVGEPARPIVDGAVLEGWPPQRADWVADTDAASALLASATAGRRRGAGQGSRAAGLERVALRL